MTQDGEASQPDQNRAPKSRWQRFRGGVRHTRNRFLDWWDDNYFVIVIGILSIMLLVLYLSPSIFITVPAGHTGVKWLRFFGGTVLSKTFPEGLRVKAPWDLLEIYDLRLQLIENEFDVLSSDGLSMKVEISTRFRLLDSHVPALHKNIGPNYINKMLVPEIGAHAREQMARYRPEQIYTSERIKIQKSILETVERELKVKYMPEAPEESFLHVEDVFIRSITLPAPVEASIKEKLVQRHIALSYEYRLERERMERQRKAIEARGIQDFQTIVSQGISEQYLQWKGIDATLELARSNNAKIVIIGAGEDGLPIILGGFDSPASSAAPGAAAGTPISSGTAPGSETLPQNLAPPLSGIDPGRLANVPQSPLPGTYLRDGLAPNGASDIRMTFSESGDISLSQAPSSTTPSSAAPSSSNPSSATAPSSAVPPSTSFPETGTSGTSPGASSPGTPPPTR